MAELRTEEIVKMEMDVEMTCENCAKAISKALENLDGVHRFEVDINNQLVILETILPSFKVLEAIEKTGRRAVLKGQGSSDGSHLGAAVAEINGTCGVVGVVRFLQLNERTCVIDGTVDGLRKGEHGLHIHEFGDLSMGCESVGEHYNPTNSQHGSPKDKERHYGDLGNIEADSSGRAVFRVEDNVVKVSDIIGRSLVVTEDKDDLGCGSNEKSKIDGNSGVRLSCGIIARSAGLFQNPKRICLCDGISVWDERDNPVAGESRSHK